MAKSIVIFTKISARVVSLRIHSTPMLIIQVNFIVQLCFPVFLAQSTTALVQM